MRIGGEGRIASFVDPSDAASAALRVPSAAVRGERHLRFAPGHPGADRIDIAEPEAFRFGTHLTR